MHNVSLCVRGRRHKYETMQIENQPCIQHFIPNKMKMIAVTWRNRRFHRVFLKKWLEIGWFLFIFLFFADAWSRDAMTVAGGRIHGTVM